MNEYEVYRIKLAELADQVVLDDEIMDKYADDAIGGVLAGRAYWETIDEAEKMAAASLFGKGIKAVNQWGVNRAMKKNPNLSRQEAGKEWVGSAGGQATKFISQNRGAITAGAGALAGAGAMGVGRRIAGKAVGKSIARNPYVVGGAAAGGGLLAGSMMNR